MQMTVACMECVGENLRKPEEQGSLPEVFHAELLDGGYFRVVCPKGHETIVLVQEEKYELLFDFGAAAFLDGYYRDAVASAAVAMERFLEFYVRVMSRKHAVLPASFDETWKLVAGQSERQLGAFLLLYLVENKRKPPYPEKLAELRNRAVHKGYLPTQAETLKFLQSVFEFVVAVHGELGASFQTLLDQEVFANLRRAETEASRAGKARVVTVTMPTMFSVALSRDPTVSGLSFLERLELFRNAKTAWRPQPVPKNSASK